MTTDNHAGKTVLSARELSKTYAGQTVLHNVSLDVRPGSVHSIVGGNGSGKSTTVKILAGVLHADPGGSITIDGTTHPANKFTPAGAKAAGLHVVHQELGLFPDLTVAENLTLGRGYGARAAGRIPWHAVRSRARSVLNRFDLDVDPAELLANLRPADQTVVAIARALQDQENAHSGVLVLDEPTAALAAAEVDHLLARMRMFAQRGQAIVFISHRLDEVCAVSDEVTVLRDGRKIDTVDAAGLTTGLLATMIVGRDLTAVAPTTKTGPRTRRLHVAGLSVANLRDLTFDVDAGEIVGIAGLLGSGRTRLLGALYGVEPHEGRIELDGVPVRLGSPRQALNVGIGMVPENRAQDAAFSEQSVAHNLSVTDVRRYWRTGRLHHRAERRDATKSIEQFGIVAHGTSTPIVTLSGGNQQKVIVARTLRRRPRLLLLDEPSQGVDIAARGELHRIVRRAATDGTAVIAVSSDLSELADMSDRILVLVNGRLAHVVHGPDIDPSELTRLVYKADPTFTSHELRTESA